MFDILNEKLDSIFKRLRGRGKLSETDISEAMREIRIALLEADVNIKVVKDLISHISEKAKGSEVLASIMPGHMVIKIFHNELIRIMGNVAFEPSFNKSPFHKIMLVGLQGSGKTTFAAKLALFCRKKYGRNPLLVAADVYRPAAIQQLQTLGKSIDIPVYCESNNKTPVRICEAGSLFAKNNNLNVIIFDTAGRLHIDDEMMAELKKIKDNELPDEILFIADSMTGQDAVNAAHLFNQRLNFSGVVLTKMDGDARGGAALSILGVTGKPVCYITTGEKPGALESFNAERIVSRILGMGDIVSLVEKAEQEIDEEEAKKLQNRIKKNQFNLEDFLNQLKMIKKMGPLDQLVGLIPGANKMLKGENVDTRALSRTEAIISSMSLQERRNPKILDGSRRKRIALGSGTNLMEVNQLLKQFELMSRMFKSINKFGAGKQMNIKKIINQMGLPSIR